MKITIEMQGLKELDNALKELPKQTAKNCLRRAMTKAAEPFVNDAIALAPKRTGRLKRSITVSKMKFGKGGELFKRAYAEARASGASREEASSIGREAAGLAPEGMTSASMILGPLKSTFYSLFLEFGTAHMGPRPFMRPAWDKNKRAAIDTMAAIIWDEVQKASARLARKAAKSV